MTVSNLCEQISLEELTGWAAFFELKNEREEREIQNTKSGRTMRSG